jgi:hypothetical protein
MAATFPITVDAGAAPFSKPQFTGPYATSPTTRYLISNIVNGSVQFTGQMYKSTDSGQTWSQVDTANSPILFTGQFSHGQHAITSCADLDGVSIRVVYLDPTKHLSTALFNTTTDTWGVSTQGPIPPYAVSSDIDFSFFYQSCVQLANGDVYAIGSYDIGFSDASKPVGAFIVFSGGVWGSGFTDFSLPPEVVSPDNLIVYIPIAVVLAGGIIQCFFQFTTLNIELLPSGIYHQALSGGVLQSLERLGNSSFFDGEGVGFLAASAVYDSGPNQTYFGVVGPGAISQIRAAHATNAITLGMTLAQIDVAVSPEQVEALSLSVVSTGQVYFFYVNQNSDTGDSNFNFFINTVDTATLIGTIDTTPVRSEFILQSAALPAIGGWGIAFAGSQLYWEQAGVIPPPPTPGVSPPKGVGGGGTYFPRSLNKTLLAAQIARIYGARSQSRRGYSAEDWVTLRDFPPLSSFFLFPNAFDLCLSRELALYNLIDRQYMSCAHKPECFLWQEQDWLDSPPGWRTFNPVKAIPLPAPTDGDVVVLSFRVPYGYDGVITAQYHGYTLNFTEGSGDLQWRVRADGRYLRDMGDMLLTIGNPKQLSPVYGGLQLRSGNLVEYIVSAPNLTSLLPPPGTGNILAGLHGFFYPRM